VNHIAHGATLAKAGVRGFTNKVMQKTPYEGLRTFLGSDLRRAVGKPRAAGDV
jgi:hypothetical protein